jgi:PAS domain S-box-containing protein
LSRSGLGSADSPARTRSRELLPLALGSVLAMAGFTWHRHRVAHDETVHRDLAERALAPSDERPQWLFEHHPHAVYSLDVDGRFVDVNPACEAMTGFSRDDLRGMDSTALSAPEDAEAARATLDHIAQGEAREFETSIRTKDGELLDLRITGVPIVAGDQVVGMYGIAEDVTAANTMRRDLESARTAAEQASVAKSLFLANMSHELRTPLTSVLAASEMLRDTDPTAEQAGLLDFIDRPGQRLLRLVEDLTDFSRIEAGQTAVESSEFELRPMLDEVAGAARHTAERKALAFDWALDGDVPSTMVGDQGRIAQVLGNLLENAIKFTDSGMVRLHVGIEPGSADQVVRFAVSDTGIGMTDEQVGVLFESFSQADSSITRKYGGVGLGLAICKELVSLMGGYIEVSSNEGEGSTFSVLLPRTIPQPGGSADVSDRQAPAIRTQTVRKQS